MTKKPEDLKKTVHSIGGAMSKWPLRTITRVCREQRTNKIDTGVVNRMLQVDVEDLLGLEARAKEVDIPTEDLEAKRRALDHADAESLQRAIENEYEDLYGSGSGEWGEIEDSCPFEESGLDKACWRCPLAGNTMDRLREDQ